MLVKDKHFLKIETKGKDKNYLAQIATLAHDFYRDFKWKAGKRIVNNTGTIRYKLKS